MMNTGSIKMVEVDTYESSLGGEYIGRISCDAADKWEEQLDEMMWYYEFPFHSCWQFASQYAGDIAETCP